MASSTEGRVALALLGELVDQLVRNGVLDEAWLTQMADRVQRSHVGTAEERREIALELLDRRLTPPTGD